MHCRISITMSLPADISLDELKLRYLELEQRLQWYEEQYRLAKHRQFGASSEQAMAEQATFVFNEAEALAAPTVPDPPWSRSSSAGAKPKATVRRNWLACPPRR